ncbi:MAG: plasmid mobilization relaxosome protein MobC [Crocinitomicaceae bacterium]|nr:plasmid mobilization relaxosome protein MobC [Crocinitomicaceae bacterium]
MKEKQQSNRTRVVSTRLTEEEFKIIENGWKKSTSLKMSDYFRKVIFNRPVVKTYRNKSLDDFMHEMALLRAELNRIGVNYNQSVKKLHTLRSLPEFKRWMLTNEVEKKTLVNKIDGIKSHIAKFAASWLQS